MNEIIYSLFINDKPFELGLSPVNRFDLNDMTELANLIFNCDSRIHSVTIESHLTYMPNVPSKIEFHFERV